MKIQALLLAAVVILGTASTAPFPNDLQPQHIIVMVLPGLGTAQMTYARNQQPQTLNMDGFDVRATLLPYNLALGGRAGALSTLLNGRTDTLDGSQGNLLWEAKKLGYTTTYITTDQLFSGEGCVALGIDDKRFAGSLAVPAVLGLRHDLLMGGGAWALKGDDKNQVLLAMQKEGYSHYNGLKSNPRRMKGERLLVTDGDHVLPPAMSGRKDFLTGAWDNVLYRMPIGRGGKSFTLIYLNHVHLACAANNPAYLASEMKDIDALVGKVLEAVHSPGNTLAVMVSPYETGAMALLPGKKDPGLASVAWNAKEASGTETLVYAKGIGAETLQGAYGHEEFWRRIQGLLVRK